MSLLCTVCGMYVPLYLDHMDQCPTCGSSALCEDYDEEDDSINDYHDEEIEY